MTKLSNCELRVMGIIWDHAEKETDAPDLMTTRNEYNTKYQAGKTELAPQTISTYLARLVKKGAIEAYKKGRYSFYSPKYSRKEYREEMFKEEISLYFGAHAEKVSKAIEKLGL